MAGFTVTVEGRDYDVDAPDERTAWKWAKATHLKGITTDTPKAPPPKMFTPSGERPEPSFKDPAMLAAHPISRFAVGAAEPIMGAAQLGANLVGAGGPVNEHMAQLNQMIQQGRSDLGSTGFDWTKAAGNVMSPVNLAAAGAIPNAASTTGRIGQGAAIGGAAGAVAPVYDPENYWTQKGTQVGAGAGVGAAIPGAWEGAKAIGRAGRNVVQPYMGEWGADQAAGRLANAAVGDRRQAVIDALKRDQQFVPGSAPTAGEAAVPAGSAEFSALQRIAGETRPSTYNDIGQAQNQARIAALRGVGGTPADLQSAQATRATNAAENYSPEVMGARVTPESQNQVMASAIRSREASKASALQDAGRFQTTEAQNVVRGENFTPVTGMPRVSSRASNFPERAAEGAAAAKDALTIAKTRGNEEAYLTGLHDMLKNTVGMGDKSLHDFISRPSVRAALKEAEAAAAETGHPFPTNAGDQFTVANLQRVKQAIADQIKTKAKAGTLGATEQREVAGTLDQFTKWIGEKSPDWNKARIQFAEDSVPINQMQVGQYLENKLQPALNDSGATGAQRAATYAQALRDAPGTLKRSTGFDRYKEMGDVLNPNQVSAVEGVASDLGRKAQFEGLAQQGATAARNQIGMSMPEITPTGMFNPKISFARGVYNRIGGQATDKTLQELAKRMQSPQDTARIMENATPMQRRALVDAMMRMQATQVPNEIRGE